ncbi:Uma2 family endonuclease [Streptomyces luteireticuli]|uniref:Uma2 family endonuclease n=1 Tax=Streptomyces luteireticuli TaxID=173858 RepID=A0ABN0YDE5_9ACTN
MSAKNAHQYSLLDAADQIFEKLPGFRPEVLRGELIVTPLPDIAHAAMLSDLLLLLIGAGLHNDEVSAVQRVGVWLPTGEHDFAVPDLSLVERPWDDSHVTYNCYEPAAFRMVLEVTSLTWQTDLRTKVDVYAEAGIPVYVIVDREHRRVHILTNPHNGAYDRTIHGPGAIFTLPRSIGADVELSVDALLQA